MQHTIGFIGAGHMTRAIVGGLVTDPVTAPDILVSNRSRGKLLALCEQFAVRAAPNNAEVIAQCDTVVLSVKPQLLKNVVTELSEEFGHHRPLVVSVAAGVRCKALQSWLNMELPLVRAMPNVPSVIQEGATGLFATKSVTEEQKSLTETVFSSIGRVSWLQAEEEIDMVTALSGSGPAYFMLVIEALIRAATKAGMDAQAARQLAVQTARGTAGMIAADNRTLAQMIDDMLLPGGTTEQAVASLRQHRVSAAFKDAFDAAQLRAQQLANELN